MRFRLLDRQNKPKQLINISGKDIMINETIMRYKKVLPVENTIIVTNKKQAEYLQDVLIKNVPQENIVIEPIARNTGACVLYAALTIKKKHQDAVMVILPSDHYITDEMGFRSVITKTCNIAEESDKLITIGIKPTFPATGYGYINFNRIGVTFGKSTGYAVNEFVEKPSFEKAKQFLDSGNYLWNSGMFVWKVSVILENFQRFLPRLYYQLNQIYDYIGTAEEENIIKEIYPLLPAISIDYGILERSNDVMVVPGDFGWNDIGSWDSLGAIIPPDNEGNIVKANHIGLHTRNSVIYSNERLIATIGVENLIIADTGDALLVCAKDKAQDIKEIVDMIKAKGLDDVL